MLYLFLFFSVFIFNQSIYSMEPSKDLSTKDLPKKSLSIPKIHISNPFLSKAKNSSPRTTESSTESSTSPIVSPRDSDKSPRAVSINTTKSISNTNLNILAIQDAMKTKNYECIKQIIKNPTYNINETNALNMTALHFAVLNLVEATDQAHKESLIDIIDIICKDPRTNSALQNNSSLTASQFIQGSSPFSLIRQKLFARITLDKTITQKIFIEQMKAYNNKTDIYIINNQEIINDITETILTTQLQQGDTNIPSSALFPDYATGDFISQMINYRITQEQKETYQLIAVLHKEIEKLFLCMETNNIYSKTADEIIKIIPRRAINQKNKKKTTYLPSYATDEFLCKAIELCIKNTKKDNILSSFLLPQNNQK